MSSDSDSLGLSPAFLSLQSAKGPLVQVGNAGVGLLAAFYLGALVTPFALTRWYELLGAELAKRVLWWLVGAMVASVSGVLANSFAGRLVRGDELAAELERQSRRACWRRPRASPFATWALSRLPAPAL